MCTYIYIYTHTSNHASGGLFPHLRYFSTPLLSLAASPLSGWSSCYFSQFPETGLLLQSPLWLLSKDFRPEVHQLGSHLLSLSSPAIRSQCGLIESGLKNDLTPISVCSVCRDWTAVWGTPGDVGLGVGQYIRLPTSGFGRLPGTEYHPWL